MYYSKRAEWDRRFQKYCKKNGFEYCIINFISWIETESEGRELLRQLKAEENGSAHIVLTEQS